MTYRTLLKFITLCLVALTIAPARAAGPVIVPPAVPSTLEVPAGHKAFLISHARGTQNYVCLSKDGGVAWTFFGPQATLFDVNGNQQATHYLGANPAENGTLRPTWQHSGDTSAAWAAPIQSSIDPRFVAPGAIPWLLLQVVGSEYGPTLGHKLTYTTYIQRVNTVGGIAPSSGCGAATDVGKKALVPYETDYVFYRP